MDERRSETTTRPEAITAAIAPAAGRCLRPREAADYLGISRAKLYELVTADAIGSITIGRSRRFPIRVLNDYVDERLAAARRLQQQNDLGLSE